MIENKCRRKVLWIAYREDRANDFVGSTVVTLVGHQEPLHANVQMRLIWLGHVTRHLVDKDTLSKSVLQGTLKGVGHRGGEKKTFLANIKDSFSRPVQ